PASCTWGHGHLLGSTWLPGLKRNAITRRLISLAALREAPLSFFLSRSATVLSDSSRVGLKRLQPWTSPLADVPAPRARKSASFFSENGDSVPSGLRRTHTASM